MSEISLHLQAMKNSRPTIFEMKVRKLQPCPFCGNANISINNEDDFYWCQCSICVAEGPVGDSRLSAISRWQERN